jgi:sugar phosphate isomerase/epimerase
MPSSILLIDYNFDWVLREGYLNPRTRAGFLTLEEVASVCGELGADGLELMHPYWEGFTARQLKQMAVEAGLPLVCYIFHSDLIVPPGSGREAAERTFKLLDRTAEMGARLAMIVPGTVKPEVPLAEQRSWLVEGLAACAAHAQSIGITLVAENIDYPPVQPLMGRGSDCAAIARRVDSPAFRLIFDTAAPLFVHEAPQQALAAMVPYLSHVHLKNARPLNPGEPAGRYLDSTRGRRFQGTSLREGMVDLKPLLSELQLLDYNGCLSIEYQGEADPRQVLRQDIAYVRRLFG